MSTYSSPTIWSASSSFTRGRSSSGVAERSSHASSEMPLLERLDLLDLEAGGLEHGAPLLLGVRADVGRVAQPLGLLDLLADVERVLDDDEIVRDPRHLGDGGRDVLEVVRRDPRDDEVEGAVREREILGAADHVGLHPRRGIGADDLQARLAQPARHVAAAGGDVERRARALAPSATSRSRSSPSRCSGALPVAPPRAPTRRRSRRHAPAPPPCARRRASSPRRRRSAARRRRAPCGPPRRSCRRAARRSAARSSSARARRGCRARPRRSA